MPSLAQECMGHVPSKLNMWECGIFIKKPESKIHYNSEWDPRENAKTKGGYLEGHIAVPNYERPMKMIIQTYPAPGKDMEEPLKLEVHPTIVHNVRMGRGKREQGKEPVPNHVHWRQEYLIENSQVILCNKTTDLDIGRNIPVKDRVSFLNKNKIPLGRKINELNLIIVQPKQKSRAQDGDATLTNVLKHRLQESGQSFSEQDLERLEKSFKKENLKNMKQVRLKIDFIDTLTGSPIASCKLPMNQTICDIKNKDIGPLELDIAHPLRTCMNTVRKIIIISKKKLPVDVKPFFEMWVSEERRKDLEDIYLIQPTEWDVRGETIIMLAPVQHKLPELGMPFVTLKLCVQRVSDGHVAQEKFPFTYSSHSVISCKFCNSNPDTDGEIELPILKGRGRSLNKENYEDKKDIKPEDIFNEAHSTMYRNYSSDYPSSPESIMSPVMSPVYPNTSHSFFTIDENPMIPTTVADVIETPTTNVSSTIRSFDTEMNSAVLSPTPSMSDWDMQDEVANTTQDDINAFSNMANSIWIEADGTRQRKMPARQRLKIKSKQMDEEDYSFSNSSNLPLSLMSRFAVLFFIFLFIQVLACISVFDTGEEIHLFEFTISSIIFSLISLVL